MTYIMKDNKKYGINSNKAEDIIYNDTTVKDVLDKLDSNSNNGLIYNSETDSFGMINPYTGEWVDFIYAYFVESPLIPVMTANSGNGVTVAANSENTSYQKAYAAFDGNDETCWACAYTTGTNYLLITFDQPKIVTKMRIFANAGTIGSFELLGSNDSSNWTSLVNKYSISTSASIEKETVLLEEFKIFKLAMYNCTANQTNGLCATVQELQLYGRSC